ncbi:MAG: cell division protein ZapB [Thermoanaerobaculia bacterium]|nr:cell division protein ZapB [Thermoanaerobaculia bacterium]
MTTVWLNDLEEKIREAAKRLAELRSENETLKARVAELETMLGERDSADDGAAAWTEEREQIRERVERMVEHLEELLGEA